MRKPPRGNPAGKKFTDAELEETRQQMLAVPYEFIRKEFLKAVAESKEPRKRRMQ